MSQNIEAVIERLQEAIDDPITPITTLVGTDDLKEVLALIDGQMEAPRMTATAKRKLSLLETDGYITNGVAIFNPATGRRGLVDYLGYVGWQAAGLVRACERDQSPAPARIWLQVNIDEPVDASMADHWPADAIPPESITWCAESIGGLQVEYVRADLAHVQPTMGEGE